MQRKIQDQLGREVGVEVCGFLGGGGGLFFLFIFLCFWGFDPFRCLKFGFWLTTKMN